MAWILAAAIGTAVAAAAVIFKDSVDQWVLIFWISVAIASLSLVALAIMGLRRLKVMRRPTYDDLVARANAPVPVAPVEDRSADTSPKPLVPPDQIRIRFAEPPSNPSEWNLDWCGLVVNNKSEKYAIDASVTARFYSSETEISLYWQRNRDTSIVIRPGLSEPVPFVVRARHSDVPWGNTTFEAGVAYLCDEELIANRGRGKSLSGYMAGYDAETLLTKVSIVVTVHYEVRGATETGKSHRSFLIWIPDDHERPLWVVPVD